MSRVVNQKRKKWWVKFPLSGVTAYLTQTFWPRRTKKESASNEDFLVDAQFHTALCQVDAVIAHSRRRWKLISMKKIIKIQRIPSIEARTAVPYHSQTSNFHNSSVRDMVTLTNEALSVGNIRLTFFEEDCRWASSIHYQRYTSIGPIAVDILQPACNISV